MMVCAIAQRDHNEYGNMRVLLSKDSLFSLVRNGFLHVMMGGVAVKVIAFVSSIVVVRLLSKDDYAIIAYVDNIYNYIYLVAGLGFASGVLKYCVGDDPEENRAYFKFALKWGLVFQLAVALISLVAFGVVELPVEGAAKMGCMLVLYPCVYYTTGLLQSMMRARLMNKAYAWMGLVQAILLLALSIILVILLGVYGIVPARYASVIICVIASVVVLKGEIIGDARQLTKGEMKGFVSFSLSLLVANLFSMVIPLNESLLVNNIVQDATTIANFKISILIPMQITFFTSAIMTYFTPYLARKKPDEEAWRYSLKIEALNLAIIVLVMVLGIALTPQIISIAYGEAYLDTIDLSVWMWVAYGMNAAVRMVPLNVLPMLGFTRFNLVLAIVSSIIHFMLDVLLILQLGVYGAAYAAIVVYAVSGLLYWAYLRKKTCGGNACD